MSSPLPAIGPPGTIDLLGGPADRPETDAPRRRPEASAPESTGAPEVEEGAIQGPFEIPGEFPEFRGRELSIRREPDLNQVIVQVLDSETKEVVRQIPPEEVLSVLRQLQKTGVLLDKKG